ncbi:MAG: hypothetical protein ACQKBY_00425, partial [Verrucomicrobiales bacterium]
MPLHLTSAWSLRSISSIAGVLSLLLSFEAGASVLAYEGFDTTRYDATGGYADPTAGSSNALVWDADTTNGGAVGQGPNSYGFQNATAWDTWINDNNNIAANVYPKVQNSQLSYSGLTTTTGQVEFSRTGGTSTTEKLFYRPLNVRTDRIEN